MFHVSVFLFIIKWARIHLVARTGERRWKFKSLVPKFSISHCKANCLVELIRPPGTVVSPRRSFVLLLMFFLYFFPFFHREISDMRLCRVIGSMSNFIIQVPKLGGPPPKINLRTKTCKIRGDFRQL